MDRIRWDIWLPLATFLVGAFLGTGVAQDALNDTLHSGEAFWAMIGSILTFVAILITLWVALDARATAIATAQDTKRAVETTIKAEQGYILPAYVRLGTILKPRERGGGVEQHAIHYGFMNFGRTPAIIIRIQHDTHVMVLDAEVQPPNLGVNQQRNSHHPMMPSDELCTEPKNSNEATLTPCTSDELTDDAVAEIGLSTKVIFQGFVEYETMFNERYRRLFTYVNDCDEHGFSALTAPSHYGLDVWRDGAWVPVVN